MLKSKILLVVFLSCIPSLVITGCEGVGTNTKSFEKATANTTNNYKVLSGNVDFPDFELKFKTKSSLSSVAPRSVVSLSYSSDYPEVKLRNTVIATGLTDAKGSFTLNADVAFVPKAGDTFVLEATKRLGSAGYNNMALRTNVKWNGTNYESITKNSMLINTKTTALSIISSFNPTLLETVGTIGTMSLVNNVVTLSDINVNVKASDIDNVTALVERALKENKDPVASIVFSNGEYLIKSTKAENPLFTGCVGDPSTCTYVAPSVPIGSPIATPTPIVTPTPLDTPIPTSIPTLIPSVTPTAIPTVTPTPIPTPTVTVPVSSTLIAFESFRDGNREIYTMYEDGSTQTRITNTPAIRDYEVSFSPDRKKVIYTGYDGTNEDIYISDFNSSNALKLTTSTEDDYKAIFSSDGTKIIYTGEVGYWSDIWIMNTDGTNNINLTNMPSKIDREPSVSPNNKIAFHSSRDGNNEIYVMNFDGSGLTNLSNSSAADESPKFSPDGTKIMFLSNRANTVSGKYNIWVMDADGTNKKQLTFQDEMIGFWSPDSTKITFSSKSVTADYDLNVVNLSTGVLTTLAQTTYQEYATGWLSNGNEVLFYSNRSGGEQVYSVDLSNNNLKKLTSSGSNRNATEFAPTYIPF